MCNKKKCKKGIGRGTPKHPNAIDRELLRDGIMLNHRDGFKKTAFGRKIQMQSEFDVDGYLRSQSFSQEEVEYQGPIWNDPEHAREVQEVLAAAFGAFISEELDD